MWACEARVTEICTALSLLITSIEAHAGRDAVLHGDVFGGMGGWCHPPIDNEIRTRGYTLRRHTPGLDIGLDGRFNAFDGRWTL